MSDSFSNHKDLNVWKDSMALAKQLYVLTKGFPSDEKFCLINQIRRAAVSIPSNIAEGAARKGIKEFNQFLYIALGSASELETQVILAKELDYCDDILSEPILKKLSEIRLMLLGLIRYNEKKNHS